MTAAVVVFHVGYPASKLRLLRPPPPLLVIGNTRCATSTPPIFISTSPSHLNLHHLKELYVICNHSCHRFPNVDTAGRVEPVDFTKLCTAVSHSSVVVSAFTKPEFVTPSSSSSLEEPKLNGDWIRKLAPVSPENGMLVGFGRAVSDSGLTASIHDVHPALRGRGIGRMIIQRIVRILTAKEIYDISALCSDKERLFFTACGFGDDSMGSTTMMYTRRPDSESEQGQVTCAGRKLLLFPQKRASSNIKRGPTLHVS